MSWPALSDDVLRLGIFASVLLFMALWELAAPRRRHEIPRLFRWSNNLALVVIDALAVRLVFPLAAVGVAEVAADHGTGLWSFPELAAPVRVVVSLLVLDLVIYLQHVVFHKVPLLWRLHRVHHTDTEIDASTAVRFHPVEIILSMALKMLVVWLLGVPPLAVLVFEAGLNALAIFNHSNIRLPAGVDRVLRLLIVTPDMHRVHHSVHREETDSNYGFNLSCWDRLFRTYQPQPRDGHEGMEIGLAGFRDRREQMIDRLLIQPFRRWRA